MREPDVAQLDALAELLCRSGRLLVLTGAGCSTASGIPDYRDADGRWKHSVPVMFQDFVADGAIRRRYWARSLIGWRHLSRAEPNAGHFALARLESSGFVETLLTQNVDGLHGRAGSRRVIELHGRLSEVVCLHCRARFARPAIQQRLRMLNPDWVRLGAEPGPDGDAGLDGRGFAGFRVPDCEACGGLLKPDVVFFGEQVPKARVELAFRALRRAGALLVVGSSLMVQSGYRFVREARQIGIPVAAVNIGRTRADELFTLKVAAACDAVLPALSALLATRGRGDATNVTGIVALGEATAPASRSETRS